MRKNIVLACGGASAEVTNGPDGYNLVWMSGMTHRRAAFVDRDGVLNRSDVIGGVPHPPDTVAKVEILPGVDEALALLRQCGFALIGVTNQPDVARGTQRRANVEAINQFIQARLHLDAIYTCYHDNVDNCDCRKPRPGLLMQAARERGLDLRQSVMIGDRWSDVTAGEAAGCRTWLICLDYSQPDRCTPGACVANLLEAAQQICADQAFASPRPLDQPGRRQP